MRTTGFPLPPPDAATLKLVPSAALDGAGVVNVMVWLSWPTTSPPAQRARAAAVVAVARVGSRNRIGPYWQAGSGASCHSRITDVTAVVPQPVFALHATVPVTSSGFLPLALAPLRPLSRLYSPLIVAVNVTDCPKIEGLSRWK